MLLRPEPIPGLPMPRYLENELLVLSARTRTFWPTLSNTRRSPVRSPRARRTSRGTVICPLLVILACFCITDPFLTLSRLPYSPQKHPFSSYFPPSHSTGTKVHRPYR